ncbi:hypothetical protein TrRE_jg6902, partial [Triparma retinervis]
LVPPFFVDEEVEKAKEEEEERKQSNIRVKMKKKETGFAGTRKCYLERRRGMGIEGNETHYVVYAEDGLDMLVAAASTSTSGVYNFFEDEEALLVYKTNVLGRVPNAMNIVIPKPGRKIEYGDYNDNVDAGDDKGAKTDKSDMYAAYSSTTKREDFIVLETRKPKWNPKMEAWTMDFKGRAKLASKKNFILIDPDYEDRALFLFGKCTKNRWSFDYAYPMNPLTCLYVALTAFSSKLAVT